MVFLYTLVKNQNLADRDINHQLPTFAQDCTGFIAHDTVQINTDLAEIIEIEHIIILTN